MENKKSSTIIVLLLLTTTLFGQDSLRVWADKLDYKIGSAVAGYYFNNNYWQSTGRNYNKILYGQFNGSVAGNEMKMENIHPTLGEFDFEKGDILVTAAEEFDLYTRGHTLIWHSQTPEWFEEGDFTRDSLLAIMKYHITTIVEHYKGQIKEWDVVNEMIGDDGEYRHSKWYTVIGPEYIDSAFVWAHQADPDAILVMNDYSVAEKNNKSDKLYEIASGLIENGIPIHAIGFQAHLINNQINFVSIKSNLKRFNDLGLITNFTEVDIRMKEADFNSETAWAKQAEAYGRLLSLSLQAELSTCFFVWGFSDNDSWIPSFSDYEYGQACVYDIIYQPKPAYYALLDTLKAHNGVHVGINKLNASKSFNILPNPAQNELQISHGLQIKHLQIIDLKGRVVKELSNYQTNHAIDINELENGIYIVNVLDENHQFFTQKLIKN